MDEKGKIVAAEVVLATTELAATLAFFTDELDFALQTIFPADDPAVALPPGLAHALTDADAELELLEVCLGGED